MNWLSGCGGVAGRLRVEPVADPEVGVDVLPLGGALLQLLAQLADEDVDRAIAVGHRVAPDPLVDGLALEYLSLGAGEQVQQLELAPGQVEAVAGDEGLEAVGADLELAGEDRRGLGLVAPATVAAGHRFDPRDRLLRMGGLGDPVVDPQPPAAGCRPGRGSATLRPRAPPGRPAARSASSRPAGRAGPRHLRCAGASPPPRRAWQGR